ncbi:MAG: BTAD domain-containing putative transcriptional regulator [Acidimicrobiales bacterium]
MTGPTGRSGSTARFTRLARASGALVLLSVLLAGVPLALAHYVGWPLPHRVPTLGQLRTGLTQHGVPSSLVIKALAVVCWVAWAALVASVTAEVASLARGRTAPRMFLAGPLQSLAAVLVTAIALGFTTPAGHAPDSPAPLHLALGARTPSAVRELVLNHDQLVRFTGLPGPAATVAPTTATGMVVTPSPGVLSADQVSPAITLYVVQRGDTLWSIAQETLGDPLRWREIFSLNDGRVQPGGTVLDDPHWIYPGWTLELPTADPVALPPPGSAPPAVPLTAPPVAPPTSSLPVPSAPVSPVAPNIDHVPAVPPWGAPQATQGRHGAEVTQRPVELASGSLVAGSFATGVLTALALGRLRRRHRYRPHPPEPGRDLSPPELGATLYDLARAVRRAGAETPDESDAAVGVPVPHDEAPGATAEPPHRVSASTGATRMDTGARLGAGGVGLLEIGTREDKAVCLDLASIAGIGIDGPGARAVARAWCAMFLVGTTPGIAEMVTTSALADRLVPGLGPHPVMRRVPDADALLRAVEAETLGRGRRLAEADTPDASSYRVAHPEDPLPALMVVADSLAQDLSDRWNLVLDAAVHLDIRVVVVDNQAFDRPHITVDEHCVAVVAAPPTLAAQVEGARLFGLTADEAVDLLRSALASLDDGAVDPDEPEEGTVDRSANGTPTGHDWPAEATSGPQPSRAPIEVRLLGPYRISVHDHEITKGLRSSAKELLAWYLLRPEGASADAAVDALWPDTDPELVTKRFWHALGDLRSKLRGPGGERFDVLAKSGDHYRPDATSLTCDLWDLQRLLGQAARDEDGDTARAALRHAVDLYGGDLVDGADYMWVEPVREDLHRRALDAHLRLAELEQEAGHDEAAAEALDRATLLDGCAEEPFRRFMALQHDLGRPDSVTATWRRLQRNLAELGLDPEPATSRLYRHLISDVRPEAVEV